MPACGEGRQAATQNARALVSVVIPARTHPEAILAAVQSVLRQTYSHLEVIVVHDGADPATAAALEHLGDDRLTVLPLQVARRAGAARNAGVVAAHGQYVAFLDDQNTWRPGKLAAQLQALARLPHPHQAVMSCAARRHRGQTRAPAWPTRAPLPGERVADYLFVGDHAGEGPLATPTLLLARELAAACPMPTHLRAHEEADWMLDLERAGASFHVVLEPLVDVVGSAPRGPGSAAGWHTSLAWAHERAQDLGPRAFSAFVLNEAARAVVREGGRARDYLAVGAAALAGRPRLRDIARYLWRPLVRGRCA